MKLTVLLCLAALAFDGLQAASTGCSSCNSCSSCEKSGASMKTTYMGRLHETNAQGHEECVGSFSGTNTFEQPADCCWSTFAEKCKELLGGLVHLLSSATCDKCGNGPTSIDLDVKSRITKEGCKPACEAPQQLPPPQPIFVKKPVYKQIIYKPTEHCGDDCEPPRQQIQPVVVPQPVYQPIIEQVQVVPVKEGCDDCDKKHKSKKEDCGDDCEEKKHKHHHKHHKHHKHHHHKHHKKDKCEEDCD